MMFPETNSISIPGLTTYYHYLIGEEKSPTTITKYLRDLQKFLTYTAGRPITKELVITYKEELKQQYATASINSMLASLNHYFDFAGLYESKSNNNAGFTAQRKRNFQKKSTIAS